MEQIDIIVRNFMLKKYGPLSEEDQKEAFAEWDELKKDSDVQLIFDLCKEVHNNAIKQIATMTPEVEGKSILNLLIP